ncbi:MULTISPECIES: type II secretion system protein J [unclassified Sporosarcina]|uniref:PulJ/GspJ family protein n=1 Tax=unclassified Sporosarcina TaxID=2647733 RepID=UPI00203E6304|nr:MULTISPECIES: type II secretion system protein [unclassified Sporosarcina]GKV66541.1 hypothetical protein NCCP2331_26940 [Sporosarcina sp. NCCP-2331]GLB56818.1 hypothetical protein NCCP2378_26050 [Sporosarcina sp. NCCP-2378]
MKAKREKGMTLVEILAALTILGIVFIGFMTIFPQMNNMNERTEAKLETMNLAKQELAILKNSPSSIRDREIKKPIDADKETFYYPIESLEEAKKYNVEVDCYKNEEYCSKGQKEEKLYKIHIKVLNEDKLISETFGYLKLGQVSD